MSLDLLDVTDEVGVIAAVVAELGGTSCRDDVDPVERARLAGIDHSAMVWCRQRPFATLTAVHAGSDG